MDIYDATVFEKNVIKKKLFEFKQILITKEFKLYFQIYHPLI